MNHAKIVIPVQPGGSLRRIRSILRFSSGILGVLPVVGFNHSVRMFGGAFLPRIRSSLGTIFGKQKSTVRMAFSDKAFVDSGSLNVASQRPLPPIARREEDRVVYIGAAPPGWDPELPRQAEDSEEDLIDPPLAFPDPYGWIRDDSRENTEVLEHLKAENEYTKAMTAHLESFRERLYQEFLSRIQETDHSVPRPIGQESPWFYYSRTFQGKSYDVYCRAPRNTGENIRPVEWDGTPDTPILSGEEVLLDVNELAIDQEYCVLGSFEPSPSHQLVAYSVDFIGGERYSIIIKNVATGTLVEDRTAVDNTDGSIVWGEDDGSYFYMKLDEVTRPFQVYRRVVGGPDGQNDELLFEENDEMYWLAIGKTSDNKYLLIECASTESSEIHFLDLLDPNAKLACIARRRPKVLYEVDHRFGNWWVQSNWNGSNNGTKLPNFALFTSPAVADCETEWTLVRNTAGEVLFDGSYQRSLDDVACFNSHVVVSGREGGLPRIWILDLEEDSDKSTSASTVVSKAEQLQFEEEAYDVCLGTNDDFFAKSIMVGYDSLVTPTQHFDIQFDDLTQRTLVKERNVPGYNKDLYASRRSFVTSRDGTTKIPVDLLYRKDVMEKFDAPGRPVPVHMYGYGAYGSCEEATFSASLLPLLDRGFVYVLVHVRGGGEMGRQWYEEPNGGKYLCKKNTFNDFVDTARWLIDSLALTTPELISCEGRSAGGLLVGAAINQAPDLFRVAILGVPAVDLIVTMADSSINLVVVEWEEWGNPNEVKFFQYMKEYNPMDNVKVNAIYPSCLLTGGLHDPRVQFWEPTKFTAQLRHGVGAAPPSDSNNRPICLKMDMTAGHFSASDRYKYWRELAFEYAFLLDQIGLADDDDDDGGGSGKGSIPSKRDLAC